MTKSDLRKSLRARRAALAADTGWQADLLVHTLFLADRVTSRFGVARCVSGYISDGEEVDPTPILFAAIDRGLTVALPHVAGRKSPMRFLRWEPGDVLVPGAFGLLQPRSDAAEVDPDLILTPLVGFDRRLARIGKGAGFYDRAFARLPDARRIGLAWSAQEADVVPTDPWDVPLHAVATETEWIEA
ncbi:5-formyltetrahydrofolate cyclo-ligase [Sphingomonas solaris]|uniref:5-formyltetrahydrofolate cyclo-ligase n=1 Tax=Alterirhizorhabdus solaris TaxID=2529389 RepID=A0A558R1L5_9SPHN|nr:5-formyltetrahydrofolate cyclo-ligase [Sphingomonas solaris]TVV73275.1 5-formyltetrahydrofolate cyclo-ligase [Sphingomonas solaris]